MNIIKRFYSSCAAVSAIFAVNSFLPQARAYDFQYTFWSVFSTNALNYVVGQTNIQRTAENSNPTNGVTYWNPINNGQQASLTFKFTFNRPTTSIFLNAGGMNSGTIAAYNFGGGEIGSGSFWASTNGTDWTLLADEPQPTGEVGVACHYATNLPISLTGATQIWFQVRLETSGYDIMAQFLRQDPWGENNNIFELDANLASPLSISVAALNLNWFAQSNVNYQVQSSADLQTWTDFTNIIGAGCNTNILTWVSGPQTFYRLAPQ